MTSTYAPRCGPTFAPRPSPASTPRTSSRDYDGKPLHVIHRDVSPHNVLVTYSGEVKLVDFGIAKATINMTKTEHGTIKGKVAYMAPEQADGKEIDRRADVFSMGTVLWGLLAGERLFRGDALRAIQQVRHDRIRRVSEVADVPPELDDIVARALDRDCDKRYQTAEEMRLALEGFLRRHDFVSPHDVAELMGKLFEARRAQIKRQIQRHMARAGSGSAPSLSRIAALSLSGQSPAVNTPGSISRDRLVPETTSVSLDDQSKPPDATPLATHSSVSAALKARGTRSLALVMGGVAVTASLAIALATAAIRGAGPHVTASAPTAAASPEDVEPSAAEPAPAPSTRVLPAPPSTSADPMPSASAAVPQEIPRPEPSAGPKAPPAHSTTPNRPTHAKPRLDPDPWR